MRVSEAAVGSETERDSTGRLKQEIVTYALNVEQREMIARYAINPYVQNIRLILYLEYLSKYSYLLLILRLIKFNLYINTVFKCIVICKLRCFAVDGVDFDKIK